MDMKKTNIIRIGDFKATGKIVNAALAVLKSNRITEGEVTSEFEHEFAGISGKRYNVAVNSGTSALISALDALKFKYGVNTDSQVITTPVTYIADANAIIHSRLTPTFVDIDIPSLLITPDKIKEKIDDTVDNTCESISGILPVHLFGQMCNMSEINSIAKENSLFVLEDAAQAHGSTVDGDIAGSFGDISIFSFYVAHNMVAGEMGVVSSDYQSIIKYVKSIKSNGRVCTCDVCKRSEGKCPYQDKVQDPRFTHQYIGYNFKTTDLISSIALAQIKDLDKIITKRENNVRFLNYKIEDITHIFHLPKLPKRGDKISYLAYPMVLKQEYSDSVNIAKFRHELEQNGIETRPIFPSIPTRQPAYRKFKNAYYELLPNAEYVSDNGLYIGCHQYLSQDDLDRIVKTVDKILLHGGVLN
ncbi:MAG: DegT/DnrJ/EryC1/StrS family aminotransferase [Candidatus Omnitrophica bacterium]|nr:DegT/DnrJ/EryC1/StrS family aminotransferase [Candidatus Omnitrophota bacterium]